jgi:hypothetical protein
LQNFFRQLWEELDDEEIVSSNEIELKFTDLMTSLNSDAVQIKLGQYLQDARRLRENNQFRKALSIVLVVAEYYWRKHQPFRAAGLLLEAGDLFYLIQQNELSTRCLDAAFTLASSPPPRQWWEFEILASLVLFNAALALVETPSELSKRIRTLRNALPDPLRVKLGRQDGYRIAITFRRAYRSRSMHPINSLDMKLTTRKNAETDTLYEYLMNLTERYALIQDGLRALRQLMQDEE